MNKQPHIRLGASAIIAVGLIISACGERAALFGDLPDDAVLMKGTVYGWYCGVRDWFNNPISENQARFSVVTGERARVTFVNDKGSEFALLTNDSSEVEFLIDAGAYKVVVETDYSYPPDTFAVELEQGDTALKLDIVYSVTDPDDIIIDFVYPEIGAFRPVVEEWAIINQLNQATLASGKPQPALDIKGADPYDFRTIGSYTISAYSRYTLPVLRDRVGSKTGYNVPEADFLIQAALDADTTGHFPPNLNVYPVGVYLCLQ